jgi:hypothetical protein
MPLGGDVEVGVHEGEADESSYTAPAAAGGALLHLNWRIWGRTAWSRWSAPVWCAVWLASNRVSAMVLGPELPI